MLVVTFFGFAGFTTLPNTFPELKTLILGPGPIDGGGALTVPVTKENIDRLSQAGSILISYS